MKEIYKLVEKNSGDIYISSSQDKPSGGLFDVELIKECKDNELSFWLDYYILKYNSMFPHGLNKEWHCSKELLDVMRNEYDVCIDTWKSIVLTKEDFQKLRDYNGLPYGRQYNNPEWKGTIDRYKQYLFQKEKATQNRKKIEKLPHYVMKNEQCLTKAEVRFTWDLNDLIDSYNHGVSTWRLDKFGVLEKTSTTGSYAHEFASDRIILYPLRNGVFKWEMFKKLIENKGLKFDNYSFYLDGNETSLQELIKNKSTQCDKIEIFSQD